MTPIYFFVGPTAFGLPPEVLGFATLCEPVAAGSIEAVLQREGEPGVMVLVDGNLECPVSDAEVLLAVAAGWEVWGVASVGALKAAALGKCGVRGFGRVARYVRWFPERAVDEVAALYFATPPYEPASEPLLELRALLRELRRCGGISREQERLWSAELRERPLEDRTEAFVRRRAPEAVGWMEAGWKAQGETWRWKRRDLLEFVDYFRNCGRASSVARSSAEIGPGR